MTPAELREIDAQVAREVMGFKDVANVYCWGGFVPCLCNPPGCDPEPVEKYTSDHAACAKVKARMREFEAACVIGSNGCADQVSCWFIDGSWSLGRQQNEVPEHGDPHLWGSATAETEPLAVCLAALAAVRGGAA